MSLYTRRCGIYVFFTCLRATFVTLVWINSQGSVNMMNFPRKLNKSKREIVSQQEKIEYNFLFDFILINFLFITVKIIRYLSLP